MSVTVLMAEYMLLLNFFIFISDDADCVSGGYKRIMVNYYGRTKQRNQSEQ